MGCEGIKMGSAYNCATPPVAGVRQRLILINMEDFQAATVTYDPTLTSLITSIVLPLGKQGWAFEGVRTSLRPQSAFVPAAYSVGYDHQLDLIVFDVSQAQKDNLEGMGLNRVVGIIQNFNAVGNGDSVFEVYGKDTGMEMQTLTRINGDAETLGAYSLGLKTSDETGKEPKLPTSVWDTDFETTLAMVDALLVPAP